MAGSKKKSNIVVVIDMQNDFISGPLGNKETRGLVKKIKDFLSSFDGDIYFTKDTHDKKYLKTQEGKNLPYIHCVKNTLGHQIVGDLISFTNKKNVIEKSSFTSPDVGNFFYKINKRNEINSITLVGVMSDICVISCALLLKAYLPETPMFAVKKCIAGTAPSNNLAAIKILESNQIKVI